MRPAPGLNKAQQEAYLASVKAFQNGTRPKGPAPSGGVRKNPRDIGVPLGPDDRPLGMQPRPKPNAGGVMGFPVKPKGGGAMGGMGPKPSGPRKPMPMSGVAGPALSAMSKGLTGMKKGGMATKKKAGKISEYGGKEMYSSKKGMMKHEGMESMKMEKSEGKMKQGGMAKKGRGLAVMIAIGKPKGRGK